MFNNGISLIVITGATKPGIRDPGPGIGRDWPGPDHHRVTIIISQRQETDESVIAIISKHGNRDPTVPNAKNRDRVPASPIRSRVL